MRRAVLYEERIRSAHQNEPPVGRAVHVRPLPDGVSNEERTRRPFQNAPTERAAILVRQMPEEVPNGALLQIAPRPPPDPRHGPPPAVRRLREAVPEDTRAPAQHPFEPRLQLQRLPEDLLLQHEAPPAPVHALRRPAVPVRDLRRSFQTTGQAARALPDPPRHSAVLV